MSVSHSYNPSDYEYLLRSTTEGSPAAKAEALKRFQILASSDKKQFAVYAKRIIIALQQLVNQPKEEINIHATMLVLEIINLNPKDIEYYIRTKLLRKIVANLGDSAPQLRKTSHYSILAYIKTFKSLDEVLQMYVDHGLNSPQPQVRQKAINSYQSIIITDNRYLNWKSSSFRNLFELLVQKLKDPNPFVQKASEQALLTLSRMEEVHQFSKKLSLPIAGQYKAFCDNQRQLGNLQAIKLEDDEALLTNKGSLARESSRSEKVIKEISASSDKINRIIKQDAINKQALIERIEELRRNSKTPVNIPDPVIKNKEIKEQKDKEKLVPLFSHREPSNIVIERKKQRSPSKTGENDEKVIHAVIFAKKSQKIENVFGNKLFEDLKNDKDWKIRLQAVEELSQKFEIYKEAIEPQTLIKNILPPLIALLSDQNFKISTLTLKLFEQLLRIPELSLDTVAPQIVEILGDGKIVLRQGVARLIRSEYLRLYNPIWIDCLLDILLRPSSTHILKEDILGILYRLYEDEVIRYPFEKIISSVCPLMEDPRTKVKIRTLDLLVKIATSTQKIDAIKGIVSSKLNQVYYEMFVQKINMEIKNRVTPRLTESEPPPRHQSRSLSFPSLRRHKQSANDTTSSSLQKYSKTIETKPIPRTISNIVPKGDLSYNTPDKNQHFQPFQERQRSTLTPAESVRKKPIKNYKKRIQRSIQTKLSLTNTIQSEGLKPLPDPEKEIKNLATELRSEDWQSAFDGLTKFRKLLRFHSQLLVSEISRPLIQQTAKLVESLRSSLSKNAVIALGQCSQVLGRTLDPDLDNIFSRLMRKTLDTNSFISDEVKKTLTIVSTNSNQSKVLSLLVNYHTSKAIPVKVNIISVLQALAHKEKIVEKEPQKMVTILVDFMKEGALQIRDRSKTLLGKLYEMDNSGKITKLLPSELLTKLRKRKESQHSHKVVKENSIVVPPIKPEPSSREESPSKRKKITTFPKEFEELGDMLLSCQTPEWKVRMTALSKVAALVKTYPEEVMQHRLSTRVIQMFGKHSNDPNSKVSTSALTLFIQIVPLVPKLIESNLSVLSNELLSCFASQKSEIRELALNLFDLIAQKVQNWMLIQHLCNGAIYGPAKAKASTLVKILKVLPSAFREKKSVVEKHIYSLINKLTEEPKGDFFPILRELINMTLTLGQDQAYASLKQSAKKLIQG